MTGLEYSCPTCPYNRLNRQNSESVSSAHCQAAKELIKAEFGIDVPCGLAGAAVVDVTGGGEKGDIYDMAEQKVIDDRSSRLGSLALGQNAAPTST